MQSAKFIKSKPKEQLKYDPSKLPRTTKYDHIEGKLKTGPTVRDVEMLTDARVAKVRNEIFERISAKKLNQILALNDAIMEAEDENTMYMNQLSKKSETIDRE